MLSSSCRSLCFGLLMHISCPRNDSFARLYNHVRELREGNIDFSMDVKGFRNKRRCGKLRDWWSAAWSVALWPFYMMLASLSAIAGAIVQRLGG